jgi:hypothetical protein
MILTVTVPTILPIFAAPLHENVSKSLKKVEWHGNRDVASELFKSPIVLTKKNKNQYGENQF